MSPDVQVAISLWGATVATALGAIKIWEVLRDRPRIIPSYSFTTAPEIGNRVFLRNNSKVPALVEYWELVWADRSWGRTRFERVEAVDDGTDPGFSVPAHGQHTLHFAEGEHFVTRREINGHSVKLYLRLYFAGRRSASWMLVWDG